ncbi:MAG: S8 family peptidase [Pseudomonadota bacterium]
MNLRALCAVAALMATCVVVAPLSATAAERQPQRLRPLAASATEGRVIVKFKAGATATRAHALAAHAPKDAVADTLQRRADTLALRRGVALAAGRAISERSQVVRAAGIDSATLARVLAADPDVEYAVPDRRRRRAAVPNDPLYGPVPGSSPASGQWYLKAPSTETPASINAVNGWERSVGSTTMVVAVLDTGVRYDHDDLAGKLLPGRDMVSDAALANDGQDTSTNGDRDADASDPGDWVSAADQQNSLFADCEQSDSSWHGTTVSGLIAAATNNGIGMAGVSWNAKILPVRVLGKCFGYDSDIAAGMRWAAGLSVPGEPVNPHPARVINMSLGGEGACEGHYPDAVAELQAAGVVVVAAAGNSSGLAVDAPGNCPGVIAVAGVRHVGTKVGYSNVGPEVSIAAPAGNCVNELGACLYPILSTTNAGTTTPATGAGATRYTDAFNISVGTSFSAPLVSGAVALMLSVNPSLTPAQVKAALKATARPFPGTGGSAGITVCQAPSATEQAECYCTTSTCGAGMLDVGAAVQAAAASLPSPGVNGLQAGIAATPQSPVVGQVISLSASETQVDLGRTIASYGWSLVSGADIASLTVSGSDASIATLTTTAAGTVTVRLTVADDLGNSASADKTITVAAAATPSEGNSDGGGGGGGGAMSAVWLLALAGAVAALRGARRQAAA